MKKTNYLSEVTISGGKLGAFEYSSGYGRILDSADVIDAIFAHVNSYLDYFAEDKNAAQPEDKRNYVENLLQKYYLSQFDLVSYSCGSSQMTDGGKRSAGSGKTRSIGRSTLR